MSTLPDALPEVKTADRAGPERHIFSPTALGFHTQTLSLELPDRERSGDDADEGSDHHDHHDDGDRPEHDDLDAR